MARLITLILIVIAALAGLTMYKMQDTGYLNFGIGAFKYETNLILAGGALLAAAFVLLLLFKLYGVLHRVFLYFGAQRKTRLVEKARNALSQGLIELAEGRFKEAETILLKQIKHSDNALLAYLSAARAAQQLGEHERRDEYLRKAHEATPTAEIAIGLTKAELQLAHEQYEQALANLKHLYELAPKHAYVIRLLLQTYRRLADWSSIQALLVDVKKQKLLAHEKIQQLELDAWHGLMSEHSHGQDVSRLTALWEQLPDAQKKDAGLVEHYALLLIECNELTLAEQVLRNTLKSGWSDSLIMVYAELDVVIDNQQLAQVESWLPEHPHNAFLLLALGKLCFNKKLWGKARNHLEASIAIQPLPETYLRLAQLLEQHMDDAGQAQIYYRRGLECLAGEHRQEVVAEALQHSTEMPSTKPAAPDVS